MEFCPRDPADFWAQAQSDVTKSNCFSCLTLWLTSLFENENLENNSKFTRVLLISRAISNPARLTSEHNPFILQSEETFVHFSVKTKKEKIPKIY